MPELLILLLSLIGCSVITFFIVRNLYSNKVYSAEKEFIQLNEQNVFLQRELSEKDNKLELIEKELKEADIKLAQMDTERDYLNKNLSEQKEEIESLNKKMQTEFKNLANEILEEKSKKFTELNKNQIDNILNPLKDKIKDFEEKVEKSYKIESSERNALKGQVEQLAKLNQQVSNEAKNLTNALKGDVKKQGNWGEHIILEKILEHAGLQKGVHYEREKSFNVEDGVNQRPDFIINLPDSKHLVIDSKVSLNAYVALQDADSESTKETFIKKLVLSVKEHIKELSQKSYDTLYQINSPDYVLMFLPIEPAYYLAIEQDQNLFMDALNKKIIMATPSNLLVIMRTVSYIWTQENNKEKVLEIAKHSGDLYNKFVTFVEKIQKIGENLDRSQRSYQDALKTLTNDRQGLIRKAKNLEEIGRSHVKKSIDKEKLDQLLED